MGYETQFTGKLKLNKKLTPELFQKLKALNNTRRMKRDIEGYGVDGEFYLEDNEDFVLDYNEPPSTQPSLWCPWQPTSKTTLGIVGRNKHYNPLSWIEYIIKSFLEPEGYVLNGTIHFKGEDKEDRGYFTIVDNAIDPYDSNEPYAQGRW